ncbi:hypothetical protein GNI_006690 [Gregarina niphandrodes]|uniref:Uncharacterized protein n=1 Tax=Gregarina niphandrodes TaxID=110365 RepID=A0A023BDH2_GRENI|nr:hypothetical protein GNI_006690 [Gregarina niphandrodes]EZG87575.1 hypothetical protein GNI_006690 [Gregarina niphandrodes]|eukprot:XP_011128646.1 hypothetical protein GNI_006690 [Gregarina niphandrodes]
MTLNHQAALVKVLNCTYEWDLEFFTRRVGLCYKTAVVDIWLSRMRSRVDDNVVASLIDIHTRAPDGVDLISPHLLAQLPSNHPYFTSLYRYVEQGVLRTLHRMKLQDLRHREQSVLFSGSFIHNNETYSDRIVHLMMIPRLPITTSDSGLPVAPTSSETSTTLVMNLIDRINCILHDATPRHAADHVVNDHTMTDHAGNNAAHFGTPTANSVSRSGGTPSLEGRSRAESDDIFCLLHLVCNLTNYICWLRVHDLARHDAALKLVAQKFPNPFDSSRVSSAAEVYEIELLTVAKGLLLLLTYAPTHIVYPLAPKDQGWSLAEQAFRLAVGSHPVLDRRCVTFNSDDSAVLYKSTMLLAHGSLRVGRLPEFGSHQLATEQCKSRQLATHRKEFSKSGTHSLSRSRTPSDAESLFTDEASSSDEELDLRRVVSLAVHALTNQLELKARQRDRVRPDEVPLSVLQTLGDAASIPFHLDVMLQSQITLQPGLPSGLQPGSPPGLHPKSETTGDSFSAVQQPLTQPAPLHTRATVPVTIQTQAIAHTCATVAWSSPAAAREVLPAATEAHTYTKTIYCTTNSRTDGLVRNTFKRVREQESFVNDLFAVDENCDIASGTTQPVAILGSDNEELTDLHSGLPNDDLEEPSLFNRGSEGDENKHAAAAIQSNVTPIPLPRRGWIDAGEPFHGTSSAVKDPSVKSHSVPRKATTAASTIDRVDAGATTTTATTSDTDAQVLTAVGDASSASSTFPVISHVQLKAGKKQRSSRSVERRGLDVWVEKRLIKPSVPSEHHGWCSKKPRTE